MEHLTFADLHNPQSVRAIFHGKRQVWIAASPDTAFQEWPGSWELWQKMEDGRLLRVQRWLKKSIIATSKED